MFHTHLTFKQCSAYTSLPHSVPHTRTSVWYSVPHTLDFRAVFHTHTHFTFKQCSAYTHFTSVQCCKHTLFTFVQCSTHIHTLPIRTLHFPPVFHTYFPFRSVRHTSVSYSVTRKLDFRSVPHVHSSLSYSVTHTLHCRTVFHVPHTHFTFHLNSVRHLLFNNFYTNLSYIFKKTVTLCSTPFI